MLPYLLSIWGCIPEISSGCTDMSNAASAYLGLVAGAAIGAVVSWWVYNRQKKTSDQQDRILCRIKDLEENHDAILRKLADFDDKHESSLNALGELDTKVRSLLDREG